MHEEEGAPGVSIFLGLILAFFILGLIDKYIGIPCMSTTLCGPGDSTGTVIFFSFIGLWLVCGLGIYSLMERSEKNSTFNPKDHIVDDEKSSK